MAYKEQLSEYLEWFEDLSKEDLDKLFKLATYKTIKAGELYVDLNSERRKIAYLQKGIMRSYYIREDGEEITSQFRWEKHIIGSFEVLLEKKPSSLIIQALEDCEFWEIDFDVFQNFMEENPKFEKAKEKILHQLIIYYHKRIKSFIINTPEERYEQLLQEGMLANRVQDKYIASFLGVTPVSLSRIRKRISKKS